MNNIGAIILAAGRGTRMNSTIHNKVMNEIGGEPMLARSVARLAEVGLHTIVVVVGFAREEIIKFFREKVTFAIQDIQDGTAKATEIGLSKLPKNISDVLVVNGDDSYLYETRLLQKLISTHTQKHADVTMLTVTVSNPTGLGRVLRDKENKIIGSVEEKDASDRERKITEINPQCWVFSVEFLKTYLPKIQKSTVTGEYYLNAILELAVSDRKNVIDIPAGEILWRGVNRPEELEEARKLVTV